MKSMILSVLVALAIFMACEDNTITPPVSTPISISSPADGAVLHDIQLIRAISQSGLSFDSVDFYIDSTFITRDSIAPFEYQWNIFIYTSNTMHSIYAVGFDGDSTYVSDLVTVTVLFPSGFSISSTYSPSSQRAVGVTSYGNVLFVSSADAGLEMLDISVRSAPQFLSRYNSPGQALHSDVGFPYVYIADRDQGVVSAIFSDIDSIIPQFHYSTQSLAIDVAASSRFLFVAENDALSVLALSDLSEYSRLAFPQDILKYVVARHDTAFIAGSSSFYIVDCTSPSSPAIVSTYDNLSVARAVAVLDTFAFIANGSDGVIALSIADPPNPRFLARFNPGLIVTAVSAGDNTLFAGTNAGFIYALDYASPGTLELLDQVDINALIEEIEYRDNYVYAAATNNVNIIRYVR